ncbi:MAG TPA: site-specific integrase [Sunxiuqinia sp.]|nr:site-specific integrase [Sunxiuqinia sp.]
MRVIFMYYLRRSRVKQSGQILIYVWFTVKSKRADLSTSSFIHPKYWSQPGQCVKDKAPGAYTINERLIKLRTEIQGLYYQFKSNGKEITVTAIKNELLQYSKSKGVLEVFDYYLESILAKLKKGYAMETYKHYKSSRKRLASFINFKYKLADFPLNSINYKFLDSFDVYLKQEHNVHQNTAWNYHKHLRRVLNLAASMEDIQKNPYNKYKVKLEETHREFLTSEELTRIEVKEIQIERLAVVRDIFVFACYTGLSYSNISKLGKKHLRIGKDQKEWIIIDRTKTKNRCRIPILPIAKEILDNYEEYPS